MKAIADEAKQAGINPATLRRAKTRLKVRSRKVGMPGSHYQKWMWQLPDDEGVQRTTEGAQADTDEHLRASETHKSGYGNNLAEGVHPTESEHLQHEDEHVQAAFD